MPTASVHESRQQQCQTEYDQERPRRGVGDGAALAQPLDHPKVVLAHVAELPRVAVAALLSLVVEARVLFGAVEDEPWHGRRRRS